MSSMMGLKLHLLLPIVISTLTSFNTFAAGCFTSMFVFGDSLNDAGNLAVLNASPDYTPHMARPPNGETYFHHPTGRSCDGRIIVDLIGQYYGIPLLPPYVPFRRGQVKDDRGGMNFAVAGAGAVNNSVWERIGVHNGVTNKTMRVQLDWFTQYLNSLLHTKNLSNYGELLKGSLVVLGPFGGNDYRYMLLNGKTFHDALSYAPLVVNTIAKTIEDIIGMGAKTIMIPGLVPDGCLPFSLEYFRNMNNNGEDGVRYDPTTGCLRWVDGIAEHHNELLQRKLVELRSQYPHSSIIYGDYYNAVVQLYLSPEKFGFSSQKKQEACCGVGRLPYNYDMNDQCGDPGTSACPQPSSYISWDGCHFTEAANMWISKALLEGPYTTPPMAQSCTSSSNPTPSQYISSL